MTFVTIGIVDSFARFRTLVLVIAGVFGLFVAKSVPFIIATGGSAKLYGPVKSMIEDNNDFGLALNMTLPLFFFLAQTESKPWLKRLFGVLFLLTIPAVFFTYSRGALVGLVAVLALMFLQLRRRAFLVPVVLLGAAVAIFFAPQAWRERMDPTGEGALDTSALSRINAWTFSWNLAKEYPIAGGGFGTFTGKLYRIYAPHPEDVHGPHSVYFQVLGEHGFVGLFLYLTLFVSCFASTHRVIKWARVYGDEVATSYANMFRYSLVGFGASGLFLGRAYLDYSYTIVACIVVLTRVCFLAWSETESAVLLDGNEELEAGFSGGAVASL
jgi:probable O-glycosylation ligase (exosortase A-associated)